jgi:hypothetical protein
MRLNVESGVIQAILEQMPDAGAAVAEESFEKKVF